MTVCSVAALALAVGAVPEWEMDLEVDDAAGKPLVRRVVSSAAAPAESVEPDGVRRLVWPSVVDVGGERSAPASSC